MGLFDVLGKGLFGVMDLTAKLLTLQADKIDQMSDEEIEKKFSKDADLMRAEVEQGRMQAEMWQIKRDEMEMQKETSQRGED